MLFLKPVKKAFAVLIALLLTAGSAAAVNMPANFGSNEWAMNNWYEAVRYLDHLTDNSVQQRMLAVSENEDLREEIWHEFWIKYDPVTSTDVNEFRRKYFERIAYANEHFSTMTHDEGWLTDRGEAFVKLGPPADVQKLSVDALGGAPLIVWDYENAYGEALFFLDYGDRDIYLINPNQMAEHRQVKWNLKKGM
jgi:GWxTD domain-containing protein